MNYLKQLGLFSFLIFSIGCVSNKRKANTNSKKPNIVLIYMDDVGWKDVSYAGSTFYETPNIDALAASGMSFTRAYSPAPVCAPSRGAVVTGRTPARNKYTNVSYGGKNATKDDAIREQSKEYGIGNQNIEGKMRSVLGKENTLFAEKLVDAGYETAYFGKWHNGSFDGFRPGDRGYKHVAGIATPGDGGFYDHVLTEKSLKKLPSLPEAKVGDYLSELLTNRSIDFMDKNKDKPFLLHLGHYLVHGPIIPNKELLPKYENKKGNDQSNPKYATMVEAMDMSVGRIVAKLEELNLLENTLILFTSDNGGLSLKGITSNYPLRGGKSFAFEGGTRVPFIASWKNKIKPNQSNDTRVIGTDIYPTILAATGLPLDKEQHRDGENLLPMFLNKKELKNRPIYFHFPHYTHATSPYSSIIEGDYKLIRYYNDAEGRYALFNLNKDISEEYDLSEQYPEIVKDLDTKLTVLLEDADAEYPTLVDSELGKKKVEKFYKGQTIGFSTKNIDTWRVRNKKTERDFADLERKCFEKLIKGEACKFPNYEQTGQKVDIDTKKLAPFIN